MRNYFASILIIIFFGNAFSQDNCFKCNWEISLSPNYHFKNSIYLEAKNGSNIASKNGYAGSISLSKMIWHNKDKKQNLTLCVGLNFAPSIVLVMSLNYFPIQCLKIGSCI